MTHCWVPPPIVTVTNSGKHSHLARCQHAKQWSLSLIVSKRPEITFGDRPAWYHQESTKKAHGMPLRDTSKIWSTLEDSVKLDAEVCRSQGKRRLNRPHHLFAANSSRKRVAGSPFILGPEILWLLLTLNSSSVLGELLATAGLLGDIRKLYNSTVVMKKCCFMVSSLVHT